MEDKSIFRRDNYERLRKEATSDNLQFPRRKLDQKANTTNPKKLVFVACGSFSPITYMHLRMFGTKSTPF
jgi:hypothetical protein